MGSMIEYSIKKNNIIKLFKYVKKQNGDVKYKKEIKKKLNG
jgi:hypothetical protein